MRCRICGADLSKPDVVCCGRKISAPTSPLHDLLAPMRERLERATPGPWRAHDWPSFPRADEYKGCVRIEGKLEITAFCFDGKPNHTALLIANAPTDLQRLLETVECLAEGLEIYTGPLPYQVGLESVREQWATKALAKAQSILSGEGES